VSRAVLHLKGRSSHKLLSEFGLPRKRYRGQHLWARGYWVVSSGKVTDEMWVDYIKNQTPPEPLQSDPAVLSAAPLIVERPEVG
jgi:REP-associated tyrosine transposase